MLLVTKHVFQAQTIISGLVADSTFDLSSHQTSVFLSIVRSAVKGRDVTVGPSASQRITFNKTPVRIHLRRFIHVVIDVNAGYNFPYPMVTRQHRPGQQYKRIVAINNGKNLRCVKCVGITKGTVRLVELHVVTNLKDCGVYLDFLFTKNA